MKTRKTGAKGIYPHALALAVALASVLPARAASFNIGELQGSFDSTLSIGASWAVRGGDPDFIGTGNGGKASSSSSDDNRLNFKKGETFSKIFKGLHDLDLRYRDSGLFLRGKYWYDFELKDEHRLLEDIDDDGRDNVAQASGAELLDAFVYHNYQVADLPGSVRLGRQVVSWGESTFIGNSINAINPIDVAAVRRPGSEIKEALTPVSMLFLTQGLSDNLSVEAFYQLEWEKTVLDNCGTFFGSDVAAKGCDDRMRVNGSDFDRAAGIDGTGVPGGYGFVPRLQDREARDGGQFGVALRLLLPELNDTEFGLYALNYHSRTPETSWVVGKGAFLDPVGGFAGRGGQSSARYFLEYPEDIRLYGLSFATSVGETAVSGEISHRPNMPLGINGSDLSAAATLGAAATSAAVNAGLPVFASGWAGSRFGSPVKGYKRLPFTQAQVTTISTFDGFLKSDSTILVTEVGYSHVGGLGSTDGTDLRFGRSGVFGNGELAGAGTAPALGGISGNQLCTLVANAANPNQCTDDGFFTRNSWGYRLSASFIYNDALAGVNLKPSLAFSHDVDGFGPTFQEGNKAISIGLNAEYLSKYTATISYTDYYGGDFNANSDRDFVAASFGVSF
ncbi:DUF1302 domain-containing protein [Metapseudomonas lalkuanensis]|uniref:DUF1302 domain-containing protein n=1 Tax=Metapseudomonas lalkuanensis TaxID=2604832 RepID=UPI001CF5D436|nr:DUF1302 domain-containing protein [Pseudomonas lalkuanensis]UCO97188.1 DUF1302 domain-containing protein [Pseudomonas lalkuanensis]